MVELELRVDPTTMRSWPMKATPLRPSASWTLYWNFRSVAPCRSAS